MSIVIIAALSENRVIGVDGGLPWRLPSDLARFKSLTTGHAVIMGRRTFDSLPGPLPGRRTIVVSRNPFFAASGIEAALNLREALECAGSDGLVFIGGGSAVYAEALPIADRMELTVVHAEVNGDTFFPEFDEADWTLGDDLRHEADDRHAYPFSFRTYERAR